MYLRTLPLTDNGGRDKVVALRPAPTVARRIESKSLLDGSRELVIEHQGSEYHLRLTRNDKLILTK
ncbi:hemin uptake protein HemP [Luteibacter sp. UNCMF366Tsu5.1]|uniref:hemin uptake protein HemP n=1 Tax=Luteibacter sp. UNCMF366Tsu5.1 TaxID=1502758 RepID=UPI000908A455|nr:hemin uptake protein HemP [Luteibacter sp. UNCMF366Tsu5.1]SFW36298.1 Hemin uptake protein hemP [Luteibacter sp. UNCMF366Tsu5.1]